MTKPRFHHSCLGCGQKYEPTRPYYTCPTCGGLLVIERDEEAVRHDIGSGRVLKERLDEYRFTKERRRYPNDSGVWLYRNFILPGFPEETIVALKEGQTDLFEVPDWLKTELGMRHLYIKMEGQSPSESFKDRGMTVAVSEALRLKNLLNLEGVVCASTGDTSASAAIYTGYVRDRLSCIVLVPCEKISASQLFQAMTYGARVRAIRHPQGFDGCMTLVNSFVEHHPELVLVNSKNDLRLVGQETIALEILQDLSWQAPDWIVIPVGNGGNLSALLASLERAKAFGLIEKLPRIIGAQSSAADTLVRWDESRFTHYEPGPFRETVASAMNINDPVSFPRIERFRGTFDLSFARADEQEILDTWGRFTRAGANICPQSAVALACAAQSRINGRIKENDVVVCISTASAVKFAESGITYHQSQEGRYANPYVSVEGTLEALEESLQSKIN